MGANLWKAESTASDVSRASYCYERHSDSNRVEQVHGRARSERPAMQGRPGCIFALPNCNIGTMQGTQQFTMALSTWPVGVGCGIPSCSHTSFEKADQRTSPWRHITYQFQEFTFSKASFLSVRYPFVEFQKLVNTFNLPPPAEGSGIST